MPRLSRQVKEVIKTIAVVLAIGLLIFFYWIYPLGRAKAMWGRVDLDTFNRDSVTARLNDPSSFKGGTATIDTFRVDADGSTLLAGVYLQSSTGLAPRGTIILLHAERADRTSLAPLALKLVDSGFAVAVYDQRAVGLSTGKYHSDGRMEASDLEAIIGHLGLHNQLTPPVIVAGWNLGADAALAAENEEKRIAAVLAVEPYLSTRRVIDSYTAEFSTWWFPVRQTMLWFWFNARSSYGLEYIEADAVPGAAGRTVLMITEGRRQSPEVHALSAKSSALLTLAATTTDQNKLVETIVTLATMTNGSN
jgi:pimeloyl-ACP methyl ester carboxylesterase